MITRHEIEVTRSMRERSKKTIIDIYIAFAVDHAPVEPGADIAWVVAQLYEANVRELRKPLRLATVLLLHHHFQLTREIIQLRMSSIAQRAAWREIPGELWRGVRALLTLAPIYARRRLSPLHAPVLSPAEWARVQALRCSS